MSRPSPALAPMLAPALALALGLHGCSDPGGADGGGSTASSDSGSTSVSASSASTSSTGPTGATEFGSTGGTADDSGTSAGSTTAGDTSSSSSSSSDGGTTDGGESSSDSASADCQYATWNPADAQANIVFSEDDLEVTVLADSVNDTARATQGKTSGRWYWEVYDDVEGTGSYNGICVADSDLILEVTPCFGGEAGFIHPRGGWTCWGAGTMGSGPTFGAGDVVGVALDADTSEAWLHVNGAWFPNPPDGGPGMPLGVAAPGGWFPCINLSQGDVFSASFGQQPFAYPVPLGFAAGVYEGEGCGDPEPPPPPPPA